MTRRDSIISAIILSAASAMAQSTSFLIEGEAFQFKGKWIVEKSSDCLGTAMLRVYQDNRSSPEDDALTVVNITEAGRYRVWTRSQDFENSARPRTFTLSVDGKAMAESGRHGVAAFHWEMVGEVDLQRKPTLLRLSDTGLYFGRCDAIFLTKDTSLDPNAMSNTEIARWRRNPATMDYSTDNAPRLDTPLDIASGYTVLASASNDRIRVSFVRLPGDGQIVCKTDYYAAGSWRRFGGTEEDNRLALVANISTTVAVNHNQYYPAWDSCTASRTFTFEGISYPVAIDGDNSNPFFTGELSEPRATGVTKTAGNCIKVTYDCGDKGTLTGYWTVPESGSHISVRLLFKPAKDGTYTLALHGLKSIPDNETAGGLMPPMYAGTRLPATPQMLFSSMMTQCVAAVSKTESFGKATAFVASDLDKFPADWGSYDNSPVGFTLRDSRGELQPVGFSPLPGMPDAKVKAGQTVEAGFITGVVDGSWGDALEYASDEIFKVGDYRRPAGCSLTEAIANIVRLIKNDTHSGWEPSLKGFWDIEADGNTTPTVVQAAPLALVGAATLAADEELYETRALPAIEYMLSRNGYRTRANLPAPLDPSASQFPTTLYEGVNTLTGGLNPWLSRVALPDGQTRAANGYFSTLQHFRQEIAAYRLTGDESRLEKAKAQADTYVDEIMSDNLAEMAAGSFYNSQMTPDWTPLVDIYNLSGDSRYLEAAIHGAAHTLAGIKSWPRVADGLQTIHPGGKYDGVTTIWWKGPEQHRLGFPREDGDAPQHDVEAWTVSSVGLGMEQPATYFLRSAGKTVRPVYMANWAPRLMELGALSGRPIFETYARNAVIGRAENYPGYYATGYTDIVSSARFPYEGPDVSSIYYHHIPAYLAMMQDFLVTEFITRSNGDIIFSPARQEGFVWFVNNIYGNSRGTILGNEAELHMPLGAVTCANPDINILTARNARQFFILLTNDGDHEAEASLSISDDILSHLSLSDATIKAKVSPREVTILTLDADFPDYTDRPALADGMRTIPTDTPAGDIYLFRIRSPFGWDSLYGFAGCGAVDGLEITATCGGVEKKATGWPYEWSFSRYGYDQPAEITITISKNGHKLQAVTCDFDGGSTGVENVSADTAAPAHPEGIFTLDGRRLDHISGPGLYIVDGKKFLKK